MTDLRGAVGLIWADVCVHDDASWLVGWRGQHPPITSSVQFASFPLFGFLPLLLLCSSSPLCQTIRLQSSWRPPLVSAHRPFPKQNVHAHVTELFLCSVPSHSYSGHSDTLRTASQSTQHVFLLVCFIQLQIKVLRDKAVCLWSRRDSHCWSVQGLSAEKQSLWETWSLEPVDMYKLIWGWLHLRLMFGVAEWPETWTHFIQWSRWSRRAGPKSEGPSGLCRRGRGTCGGERSGQSPPAASVSARSPTLSGNTSMTERHNHTLRINDVTYRLL